MSERSISSIENDSNDDLNSNSNHSYNNDNNNDYNNNNINKVPSIDSITVNEIDLFIGEMENELEEILQSKDVSITISSSSPPLPLPLSSSSPSSSSTLGTNVNTNMIEKEERNEPLLPYKKEKINMIEKEYKESDGWILYHSIEGYPYYYNSITQESEWAPYENQEEENNNNNNNINNINNGRLTPLNNNREEKENVLEILEGVTPSPNKLPINSITNIQDNNNNNDVEVEILKTNENQGVNVNLSPITSTTSLLSVATSTASTYGKTLLAVASSTASTLLQKSSNQQTYSYSDFLQHPDAVEITIPARSITKVPFILKKGYSLMCTVQVKDYDLGVALRLRKMGDGGGMEVDLYPMTRLSSGKLHNLTDSISLLNNNNNELNYENKEFNNNTRNIILVLDNSYSTFRSKSCIYTITHIETASIQNMLDIPDTIQFNEFLNDHKQSSENSEHEHDSHENEDNYNDNDSSNYLTDDIDESEKEIEEDGNLIGETKTTVELIPLAVANTLKLKSKKEYNIGNSSSNSSSNNKEYHLTDFNNSDDDDNNNNDSNNDNNNENEVMIENEMKMNEYKVKNDDDYDYDEEQKN